ncbi:MAG: HAMP domain-containing protein [Acidobacteriia bacterium]|nr:HAMP domain-containing protein [Terriglobia bacterium]
MDLGSLFRSAPRLHWRLKAILPVVGVLLLGLFAFQIVLLVQEIPNGRWILTVAASGAVVICGVLLAVLAILVERPLRELKKTITLVRTGDLQAEVKFAERNDDVGELGQHFNEMVRQLRESKAEIERLHRQEMSRAEHLATIGELAAGLAHEIRNPLAGIAGVIEVIGKDLPPNSPSREVLADVHAEIRQIQGILNDLLIYARPRPPQFHSADLNATVEQAVLLARQQVRTRPIEVLFVPSPDLTAVVHDPVQMQQVVLNLLLNGIQAIREEGRVEVILEKRSGRALIRVSDTGRGISRDVLSKIFRPFFTTRKEGTGLGLPLARGIVESHEGRIEVRSEPGRGTQIEIWIPLERRAGEGVAAKAGVVQ